METMVGASTAVVFSVLASKGYPIDTEVHMVACAKALSPVLTSALTPLTPVSCFITRSFSRFYASSSHVIYKNVSMKKIRVDGNVRIIVRIARAELNFRPCWALCEVDVTVVAGSPEICITS